MCVLTVDLIATFIIYDAFMQLGFSHWSHEWADTISKEVLTEKQHLVPLFAIKDNKDDTQSVVLMITFIQMSNTDCLTTW